MKRFFFIFGLAFFSFELMADQLTHRFANPSFIAVDANKGALLLNEANAQNGNKAPTVPSTKQSQIDAFANKVQTALLSSLSSAEAAAIKSIIINPTTGNIIPNVTVPLTGGYTISTSTPDSNNNMTITISDGISNTVFTVPYLAQ